MFRQNQSIYCKTPEIAQRVREFAKQLNQGADDVTLPDWLLDIMNGGFFPAKEECTSAESAILYDTNINPLVLSYRATRNPDLLKQIEKIIKSRKMI